MRREHSDLVVKHGGKLIVAGAVVGGMIPILVALVLEFV